MLYKILKKYFGYDTFRPLQKEAIDLVMKKKDALVVLPTGGGKSLIYQIPAAMHRGVVLVFSPLISLMKDQVDSLNELGLPAAYLNSTISYQEKQEVCLQAQTGSIKLLYIAPEGFFTESFQNYIKTIKISLIAIDEAHCISEWGHDFRPEYRRLSILKEQFPDIPLIGLTATATNRVQKDIIKQLNAPKITPLIGSFLRKNLTIYVHQSHDLLSQLIDILNSRRKVSGIIYCSTRKKVDELSENLNDMGYTNLPYHAGMEANERNKNQNDFIKEKVNLIVATVAFGMGIDKSNIRFIIHANLPKSIEGYYQEIGRAGRDGLNADCFLFHSHGDVATQQYLIDLSENQSYKDQAYTNLREILKYVRTINCRHGHIINYFGETLPNYSCKKRCDICLSDDIVENDITLETQKILSCLYRIGFPIGVSLLAGVLAGSRSKKIQRFRDLSTYGIMKDKKLDSIKELIHILIDRSIIAQAKGKYPVLNIGNNVRKILIGEQKVVVKIRIIEKREETIDYEIELLDNLKDWRRQQAESEKVPPYIIFSDKVLIDLATHLPQTDEEIRVISGIGELKYQKYKNELQYIIKQYCRPKRLKSRMRSLMIKNKVKEAKNNRITQTVNETYRLFEEGNNIEEIASQRKVVPGTIVKHVIKLIQLGKINKNQISLLVDQQKVKVIKQEFKKRGGPEVSLTPIKTSLGDEYSFDELRLVRASL